MVRLSIIIPVYNGKETITKTLNSIINNINENVELLIVDDGSTDGSDTLIKKYISTCGKEISYYSKPNGGLADARNFGIKRAKGKYVMFVDADDYINKKLITTIKTYIEEDIDIIKFKIENVDENGNTINKIDGPIFPKLTGYQAFNTLVFEDNLIDSACVYAFKRSLFVDNNYYFNVGTYHEDLGLIPLILLTAETVTSIDLYGYYYVQTKNSITRNDDYSKSIKRFEDTLLHYDNMLQFISKLDLDKKTCENVKIYYTNSILLKLKLIKKLDRKRYIKQIKKRKMINNIKTRNIKQLLKRLILSVNINWYLNVVKN